MKINYISNLSLEEVSGGWSGINYRLHKELSRYFDINYIGPVNPPSFLFEKALSKGRRLAGMKGKYHFFSEKRLEKIKDLVSTQLQEADYNFFFGQMPWTRCESNVPYGVYMDACFATYLTIFIGANAFLKNDIERIEKRECYWLNHAHYIFWGSQWALDKATERYNINHSNHAIVHVGGNVVVPDADHYSGELLFIFISLNFEKKGGYVCVKAFHLIKQQFPQAQLMIIGQQPSQDVLQQEGISYMGLLDKNNPTDLHRFQEILKRAFFLIHPTTMDTMGAVIIEAGYYGCPSIAPRSFGIPELIRDNETGVVVDVPFTHQIFAHHLLQLIKDQSKYLTMRKEVRDFTKGNLTWRMIGERIRDTIKDR